MPSLNFLEKLSHQVSTLIPFELSSLSLKSIGLKPPNIDITLPSFFKAWRNYCLLIPVNSFQYFDSLTTFYFCCYSSPNNLSFTLTKKSETLSGILLILSFRELIICFRFSLFVKAEIASLKVYLIFFNP